ncbi:MAG TPA: NAD(P)H-quinone oxidoreductase [Longimicrobiales bacterium]
MRAVLIPRPGGPEVLQLGDAATPETRPDHIRVRVRATAVNRADLMQRRGMYPAPPGWPADIPGLEYAGEVDAVGPGVTRWQLGDRVMGIVGGGSYAEYVVVHQDEAIPIPSSLSFTDAAAIPEAFLTAYDALRVRLGVPMPGSGTVLIHAIASGVGTAAMQLAHVMGLRIFGTARSEWKLDRIRSVAPATLIDAARDDFVSVIRSEIDGVDYIVDLVGGEYLEKNILAADKLGRIVLVGLVAGATAKLDLRILLNKRLTIVGTVLRARSLQEKIEIAQMFEREALPWLASGQIKPVIDRVMRMDEAAEAHRLSEANETVGKVVLTW